MKKKMGFTLIQILLAAFIITLISLFCIATVVTRNEKRSTGEFVPEANYHLRYLVTAVDRSAGMVVAIPYGNYYTNGTLHRVLLRVNENVMIVGANFIRLRDGKYYLLTE